MNLKNPLNMQIDLHVHSNISDGTLSPAKLIAEAHEAGLDVLGLTDHDTTAGWAEAELAASNYANLQLFKGIEVSAVHDSSVHILAFGIENPDQSKLVKALKKVQESRFTRLQKMVELLSKDYQITWDDVMNQFQGESAQVVGRPHIADALVKASAVENRSEAFATILSENSKYYLPYESLKVEDAIALIHADGAVAIGAHLFSNTRPSTIKPESGALKAAGKMGANSLRARLEHFIAAGLDGIEIFHREHDSTTRVKLLELAKHHDLIMTGGSDYHGSGKPNRLGENLTEPEEFQRLLEAIKARQKAS